MQARVTGAMIDFLTPGDTAAIIDAARRSGDPHRLADHHRGRLFHRSGVGQVQPDASRHRRRRAQHRRAEDRVRADPRRADAPARRRHRAVHGDVLRQHSPQRPCHRRRRHRAGRAGRPGPGRLDREQCRLSERHGRPHHAGHHATASATSLAREFGIEDNWPVFCEPFRQWVLEDNFPPAGRRWKRSACSSSRTSRPSS